MPRLLLVLSLQAENSLEDITDYYLVNHSAERTIKVIKSIEDTFLKILEHPNSFPLCFDIEKPASNIRQIILHNTFKIIYRISSDKIEIIEVFHGKRSPDLLKEIEG